MINVSRRMNIYENVTTQNTIKSTSTRSYLQNTLKSKYVRIILFHKLRVSEDNVVRRYTYFDRRERNNMTERLKQMKTLILFIL